MSWPDYSAAFKISKKVDVIMYSALISFLEGALYKCKFDFIDWM